MRPAIASAVAVLALSATAVPQVRTPFVPMGVWYAGGAAGPPAIAREPAAEIEGWRRDLAAIRFVGFNSITTWTNWAASEPERGKYDFASLEQVLDLATGAGLRVIVQVYAEPRPPWVEGTCIDHPGLRTGLLAFIGAVAARAARHPSFDGIDVSRQTLDPDCPETRARFGEWMKTTQRDERAHPTFAAWKLATDLKDLADASRPRVSRPVLGHSGTPSVVSGGPHPDDWLMSRAVELYGAAIVPKPAGSPAWTPAQLGAALDGARSAGRERGWRLARLQSGRALEGKTAGAPVTAADLRLWGWAAMSRGARSVSYDTWHSPETGTAIGWQGLTEPDGSVAARARTAGDVAGIVGRNAALFASLAPRPSRVAVVYEHDAQASSPTARASALAFYRSLFDLNIQADFIHPGETAALSSRYAAIFLAPESRLEPAIRQILASYVEQGGTLVTEPPPDGDVMRARLASLGVSPDVRIDGAPGIVEARFLESSGAMLLIALNHSDTPQKVTMTFSPDTPEAIWANLETGTAVSFVQTRAGPVHTHTFGPRDALVLVRGKRLR